MTKIYHYTKGYNIYDILSSGELLLEGQAGQKDDNRFNYHRKFKYPPQVWFTTESEIPFTCTPEIRIFGAGTPFHCFQVERDRGYLHWGDFVCGLFRLTFDATQINAQYFLGGQVMESLKSNGYWEEFEELARYGNDDVSCWYHCDKPVSLALKKSIETWRDGTWVAVNDNEALALCS